MIADLPWLATAVGLLYLGALWCIYRIFLTYRTAQGAIAWIIGLLALPYLAVPMFVLFGRYRFGGYVKARRMGDQALTSLLNRFERQTTSLPGPGRQLPDDELQALCKLGRQPLTEGNQCTLLRDGAATFEALFEAMESATRYILLEFYIVRSDKVGRRIKSILERKLAQGVDVWFLYDDIGSVFLPRTYLRELSAAGARIASFGDGNIRRRRFQINFRNHRKLLVCDGRVGFVGGINLGDEYLGITMDQEPWRDTHCQIQGPAVIGLQLAALRGVDVRILIPEKSDSQLIRLAAYSYLVQASQAGIGIYRYQPGFMHQKVLLVDDRYAAVGTANLDNRSMRLNFEIIAINTSRRFIDSVHAMLEEDLVSCRRMTERDYRDRSIVFRLGCRAVRLLAPLL